MKQTNKTQMMKKLFNTLLLCLIGFGFTANRANAANYVVSSIANSGAGTLRDAITSANSDGVDSEITFDASFFSTLKTILLTGSELGLANNGTLSITGPAAGVEVSGSTAVRVFSVGAGANVTLTGVSIIRGKSAKGAGINNAGILTVNNCTISINQSSDFGGGVYNTGTLTVNDSTLSGNTATAQYGGAICNGNDLGNVNANLTLSGCLLWNNRAVYGAGLSNQYAATATVTNCTFYNNVADARGAGVFNGGGSNLTNCTFVSNGNLGNAAGGGIYAFPNTYAGLTNCLGVQNTPDNFGAYVSDNGGNVQASTFQEAGLNPTGLANNGGPTQTIALVTKGTAVNVGVDPANAPIFDQRGSFYYRKVGGRIDSGAYESSFAIILVNNEGLTLGVGASATITQAMLYATDSANDPVSYSITAGPSHGTVKLNGNATGSFTQADIAAGTVSYTEDGTFSSTDSFAFSVTDGKGGIVTGTFPITITEAPSLVVTTTSDTVATDGFCSLREAIAYANSNPDLSAITFNIPVAQQTGGVWTISTSSALVTNENTTITGPGAALLTVKENDANKSYAVIEVRKGLTLSGVTLSNAGAGLSNKSGATSTVSNCVFTGNAYGLDNNGTATLNNCTLSSNTTSGLINNNSGAAATLTNCTLNNNGYGILNFGTATVSNCTISGSTNDGFQSQGTATVSNCNISGNSGNGFLNISSIPATLTNCTLSGNNIGILGNSGSVTVTNCTITGNSNTGFLNLNTATLNNSLVVGNTTNIGGGTAPGGSNNITTGTAAAAGLDSAGLKNNGGPTQTIALLATSTAIDAANDANAPATDQRGVTRPQGTHSDIGAYERQPSALTINNVTITEGNSGTKNATFTVALDGPSDKTITVNYSTTNGTATQPGDYTTKTGTLSFAVGQISKTITVPVNGDTIDENNETFFVNLSSATNAAIADSQGKGTINDDDALPTLSIADATPVIEDGAGARNSLYVVTLSGATNRTVKVNYATGNSIAVGSATPGVDFTAISGTMTFNPGQTSKTIVVPVLPDNLDETNEVIRVNLSGASLASITKGQGVGSITDNDATPTISINDVMQAEGNSGSSNFVFTVSLSAASGQTVTLSYVTVNGTAVKPGDYTGKAGTLTFAPGETTKTIAVPVIGNTVNEPDETFFVNLSSATNATLSDGQGQGTILNDDTSG